MQVQHSLSGIFPAVVDEAITVFADSFETGDFRGRTDDFPHDGRGVGGGSEIIQVAKMLPGYDENVGGSDRMEIPEADDMIIFIDDG